MGSPIKKNIAPRRRNKNLKRMVGFASLILYAFIEGVIYLVLFVYVPSFRGHCWIAQ